MNEAMFPLHRQAHLILSQPLPYPELPRLEIKMMTLTDAVALFSRLDSIEEPRATAQSTLGAGDYPLRGDQRCAGQRRDRRMGETAHSRDAAAVALPLHGRCSCSYLSEC